MATLDFHKTGLLNPLPGRDSPDHMTKFNLSGVGIRTSPREGSGYFEESYNLLQWVRWSHSSSVRFRYCCFSPTSSSVSSSTYQLERAKFPGLIFCLVDLSFGFTEALCWGVGHMGS